MNAAANSAGEAKLLPTIFFLSRNAYNLFYCGPTAAHMHRMLTGSIVSVETFWKVAQTGKCSVYNQGKLNFFHAQFSNQTILLNSDANLHESRLLLQAESFFFLCLPCRSVSGKKLCSSCGHPLGKGAAMIIETLSLYFHIHCFKVSCISVWVFTLHQT